MPTGLREIESSFKQVQKDYQGYAKRRQVLAIEVRNCNLQAACAEVGVVMICALKVAAQENSLKRIKIAICEERQAISKNGSTVHRAEHSCRPVVFHWVP